MTLSDKINAALVETETQMAEIEHGLAGRPLSSSLRWFELNALRSTLRRAEAHAAQIEMRTHTDAQAAVLVRR